MRGVTIISARGKGHKFSGVGGLNSERAPVRAHCTNLEVLRYTNYADHFGGRGMGGKIWEHNAQKREKGAVLIFLPFFFPYREQSLWSKWGGLPCQERLPAKLLE